MDGRCLSKYSAYEFALGIKSVCWSPSSQFLAIGSFDEKVFLEQLNYILCHNKARYTSMSCGVTHFHFTLLMKQTCAK